MANELNDSLRQIAEKVAQYVDDVATMSVQTRFVEVGPGQEGIEAGQPHNAARTEIRFDGDTLVDVPMRANPGTGLLEVDTELFNLHQRNVALTIDYRSRMLNALLEALQGARRR